MLEAPVGQRLKILINSLGMDIRAFSKALDVGETTIRNYFNRGSKPNAEFLTKLSNTFESVNLRWLLTGQGEPLTDKASNTHSSTATVKKNSGVVGTHSTQVNIGIPTSLDSCKQQLAVLTAENEGLRSTVAALETALSAKEEILTLLRGGPNRLN